MADGAAVKSTPIGMDCYIECPSPILLALRARVTAEFYEGDGQEPTNVVKCGSQCYVAVRIDFGGSKLARLLCLKWCVKVAFESCGPGREFVAGEKIIPHKVCETDHVETTLPIVFPECDPCGMVYTLCVTVTARDDCNRPAPFGGYCKGEQLMVFPAE